MRSTGVGGSTFFPSSPEVTTRRASSFVSSHVKYVIRETDEPLARRPPAPSPAPPAPPEIGFAARPPAVPPPQQPPNASARQPAVATATTASAAKREVGFMGGGK